jgi:hypothetical protein
MTPLSNQGIVLIDTMISLTVLTLIAGAITAASIVFQRLIDTSLHQETRVQSAYHRLSETPSLATGNPVILTESIQSRQLQRVILK